MFEENQVREYDGGYDDWLRQKSNRANLASPNASKKKPKGRTRESAPAKKQPLSFKEKQELKQLPDTIEQLEKEIAELHALMAEPDYYKQSADILSTKKARLVECEASLAAAFKRWDKLELRAGD